jgi:hypothetical protein|tara:strand:+ start:158 stop:361 length:204 start_codon:yes stop_codon:yes gene_type:complete
MKTDIVGTPEGIGTKALHIGSVSERSFKESEVKEICRNLARICTPSEFIVGIDDRFEEWWKVNFNAR